MLHSQPQDAFQSSHNAGASLKLPPDTFLLNPDHAQRQIGKSQLLTVFKKELLVIVCLIGLSAFFLVIVLQGLRPFLTDMQIQQSGVSAQATISGLRMAAAGGMGQTAYYLEYSFTDSSGAALAAEQMISQQTFKRFHTGDTVQVKYLADNPAVSALTDTARDNIADFGNVLTVLTGGITFAAAWALILYLGWIVGWEERYFAHGHLVMGHVLACHGHLETAPKELHVEMVGPGVGGRYMIELTYSFHAPNGKAIKATAGRQRNDLRGHMLPKFGHSVAVLVLSDKHYKVL